MFTTSRPLLIPVIPGVKRQGRIGPNAGWRIARELSERSGAPGIALLFCVPTER